LQLLQRYTTGAGDEQRTAPLDKLKGQGWNKRKSQARKSVRDMADQLLRIQAQRELASGLPLSSKNDRYIRFESEFSYVETDDQMRAIADVNADMEKIQPMDRLVCGDVGFGKTEVALRAAFRAVESGYQVLVLVPTTVLCYQHHRSFTERMHAYGIRVAQLNRFVKSKDAALTLSQLETGQVDIVVGTHRLLSKDIKPKKLGLMIVDEEQRFGVGHKEALKSIRAGCHVLTLTATPIPRTLHMAMLGLRDISIIATPPPNRLSVKTYISKWDDTLVREAIEAELNRGGQVFFLHNRVEDIVAIRQKIKDLVPAANVRFAHGQMSEDKLEQVILDFIERKFNVMVCTTIIESGIDMPNVNTLIVNNAQQFGLAQLYQIRGRVGRSSRQAYAYFMVPPEERLSDESRKRLEVLSVYQQLGSGFQVARHDLEIRGAGNLLGAEQSGRIDEVGLELYTEMLSQAIAEVRGQKVHEKVDPEIKISFAASIPGTYMESEQHRLDIYKRIFTAETLSDVSNLRLEIKDRFGPLIDEVEMLCRVAELKVILKQLRVTILLRSEHGMCELKFAALSAEEIQKITAAAQKFPRDFQLTADFRLLIAVRQMWSIKLEHQLAFCSALVERLLPLYAEPT
jgi:transcription-repair coupling factor (superfamily II helicase)